MSEADNSSEKTIPPVAEEDPLAYRKERAPLNQSPSDFVLYKKPGSSMRDPD